MFNNTKEPTTVEQNLLDEISRLNYIIACEKNDRKVIEDQYIDIINSNPEMVRLFNEEVSRRQNPNPEPDPEPSEPEEVTEDGEQNV